MELEILRTTLGYCSLINLGILLWWFLVFVFAHDKIYQTHCKWFKISVEQFSLINYAGMGIFKLVIFVFNLVPLGSIYSFSISIFPQLL